MKISYFIKITIFALVIPLMFTSCKTPDGKFKLPGGDARKTPADPAKRVAQNLKEGRGFKLNDMIKNTTRKGVFDFASSNELWRASLDAIDFMPLASVNYSGGIIITDWYSSNNDFNESIKISIRFLTNEIRADALDIKVFNKKCDEQNRCFISKNETKLISELKKKILKKAAIYNTMKEEKLKKERKKNPYIISTPGDR